MDRFKQCVALSDGCRRQQTKRATDYAGFITDYITKHIFGQYNIKLFWIQNDLHGRIIYKKKINLYVSILRCNFLDYSSPEPGCFQHIGLIYERQLFSSFLRSLKGKMRNPFNFLFGINTVV